MATNKKAVFKNLDRVLCFNMKMNMTIKFGSSLFQSELQVI